MERLCAASMSTLLPIATFQFYASIGKWDVGQCGGLINGCLDDGSPVEAECD